MKRVVIPSEARNPPLFLSRIREGFLASLGMTAIFCEHSRFTGDPAGKEMRTMMRNATSIGLISDTHGLLREEALRALEGSELIIHAGDVGNPEVIETLKAIAPVVAVRGNVDTETWASALPETEVVETGAATIFVLHDAHALDLNPAAAGFHIVISGHSHKPSRTEHDGVLYVNPGSAGPRRFQLPVTVARLNLAQTPWNVEFIDLSGAGSTWNPI